MDIEEELKNLYTDALEVEEAESRIRLRKDILALLLRTKRKESAEKIIVLFHEDNAAEITPGSDESDETSFNYSGD